MLYERQQFLPYRAKWNVARIQQELQHAAAQGAKNQGGTGHGLDIRTNFTPGNPLADITRQMLLHRAVVIGQNQ
ncbi:hypothetical protein D3C79_1070840 [compost metagenome]